MSDHWIADRMRHIDASGIRKVFDLAAKLESPINLSIGQPHFDTPEPIRIAVREALDAGRNAYSQTQGIAPLRDAVAARVAAAYPGQDRGTLITSGTSGGLVLAMMTLVNPGDEVIYFDPGFVMYRHHVTMCGGVGVPLSTYPDFKIDLERVASAITPRTKAVLFNSPANPTGAVADAAMTRGLAELCRERNVALISDEIYSAFSFDGPAPSPAKWNPETIVIDGFSKSHSMTGHRVGWCHGPQDVVEQMTKLQQFTFVCAPQPSQWGGLAGLDVDLTPYVDDYRRKRDHAVSRLSPHYDVHGGGGAFYLFLPAPGGDGQAFVERALAENLLIIPGGVFSARDTHFRVSLAAEDETLDRGLDVLIQLAS